MKKFISMFLAAFIVCMLASTVSQARDFFPMGIGPFVSAKGGVNSNDPPNGIKNGFVFNGIPDFGATFFMPFEKYSTFALLVDLGYTTYAYEQKYDADESIKWTEKYHYVTLGPSLYMSGFVAGFNFGLPMSGETDIANASGDIPSDKLSMVIELRLGGMFTLLDSPTGRLNLNVNLGYAFSGIYQSGKYGFVDDFNPIPASVSLGFNYLFNLVDVEKQYDN